MEIEVTNGTWNIKHASSDDVIELGRALIQQRKQTPIVYGASKWGGLDVLTTEPKKTHPVAEEFNSDGTYKASNGVIEFTQTAEIEIDDVWDRKEQGLTFAQACRTMINVEGQVTIEGAQAHFKKEYGFRAGRDKVRKSLNELRRDGEIGATGIPGQQGSTYHRKDRVLEHLV